MREPIELRASGGRVLIGPLAMVPPLRRGMQSPLAALGRLFQDRGAIAQLRAAWPRLEIGGGHDRLLSASEMRDVLERAIVLHRIVLLWIPSVSHHAIHVTVPPKPAAPPAIPGGTLKHAEVKSPPVPVGTMAIPAKVERALVQSFDLIARDGRKGLKEFVKAIDALRKDSVAMAKIVAFCALLAVPVVGEAAAGAFLAYAYYLLGFHGMRAALQFGAACVRAAAATTDAEIDAAAREFADAFEDLGEAVIAWLMTRIQPVSSVGARSAAAEKEATIVARAETQAAKVVKEGESYQTKVLSKYKEARDGVKAIAEMILPKGFKSAADFIRFGRTLREGLAEAGYADADAILQGSAVTGKSFRAGAPFDVGRISDFDVALTGDSLLQAAQDAGIELRSAGTRTGPLTARDLKMLGLRELSQEMSAQAGRPVNFMIYRTAESALERAPSIVLPR